MVTFEISFGKELFYQSEMTSFCWKYLSKKVWRKNQVRPLLESESCLVQQAEAKGKEGGAASAADGEDDDENEKKKSKKSKRRKKKKQAKQEEKPASEE